MSTPSEAACQAKISPVRRPSSVCSTPAEPRCFYLPVPRQKPVLTDRANRQPVCLMIVPAALSIVKGRLSPRPPAYTTGSWQGRYGAATVPSDAAYVDGVSVSRPFSLEQMTTENFRIFLVVARRDGGIIRAGWEKTAVRDSRSLRFQAFRLKRLVWLSGTLGRLGALCFCAKSTDALCLWICLH
jgi:hypothetical protein